MCVCCAVLSCSASVLSAVHSLVASSFLAMKGVMESQLRSMIQLVFQPLHPSMTAAHQQLHRQHESTLHSLVNLSLYIAQQAELIVATPAPSSAVTRRGKTASGGRPARAARATSSHGVVKGYDNTTSTFQHAQSRIPFLTSVARVV